MNLNLDEIDLNDIGNWPWVAKVLVILSIALSILILGVWLDARQQLKNLDKYEQQEKQLKQAFEVKQKQASHLQAYETQQKQMKKMLNNLLSQLPDKTEVPGLLEDISQQGLASGLEFKTIRLMPEKKIDFYVEQPIEIVVLGKYHQMAEFVSNLAALSRIVTLHDFTISSTTDTHTSERLQMNITAKTYRCAADEELSDD